MAWQDGVQRRIIRCNVSVLIWPNKFREREGRRREGMSWRENYRSTITERPIDGAKWHGMASENTANIRLGEGKYDYPWTILARSDETHDRRVNNPYTPMIRSKRGNQRFVPIPDQFVRSQRFNIRPGILCDSRLVENQRTGEKNTQTIHVTINGIFVVENISNGNTPLCRLRVWFDQWFVPG